MKRREGVGGVTIAVVGLVLALSVGIAATAQGRISDESDLTPVGVPEPGMDPTRGATKASTAPLAQVPEAGVAKAQTATVSVETVVSESAASTSGPSGNCIVKTRIVTAASVAPPALVLPRSEIGRYVKSRGGRVRAGSKV
jgi:hypothetical protein